MLGSIRCAMPSRDHRSETPDTMDLEDLPDAEEIYAIGGQEDSQRRENDTHLTQAINYLAKQGGDDTPITYMSRVNRIDETLVQGLPQGDHSFDKKLWRRLRGMVLAVKQDYEDTDEDTDEEDDAGPSEKPTESRDPRSKEFSKLTTPTSLRKPAPSLSTPDVKQDNVSREREFTYGGPGSEIEYWYRDMPPSLPFPETFRMAHWESLKIDFDLSESGKKLKADGKVIETNVSFNHEALKQYDNLHHHESGSRFKLPKISTADYDAVRKMASKAQLRDEVDHFNKGDRKEQEARNYVPRTFLPRFGVGKQGQSCFLSMNSRKTNQSIASPRGSLPSAIRKSLSTTPTRPPRSDATSAPRLPSLVAANAKIQAMQAELDVLRKSGETPRKSGLDRDPEGHDKLNGSTHKRLKTKTTLGAPVSALPRAGPAMRKFASQRTAALRASQERESLAEDSPETIDATPCPPQNKVVSPTVATAANVVIPVKRPRGLSHSSPLSEASPSTKATTTSPPTTNARLSPHIEHFVKRPRGRPRKSPAPDSSSSSISSSPPSTAALTHRKHSLGNDKYTPVGKRVKTSPAAAKPLRSARKSGVRASTPRRVDFIEISSASSDSTDEDEEESNVNDFEVETVVRQGNAASLSKAALAGKTSRAERVVVTEETIVTRATEVREIVPSRGVAALGMDEDEEEEEEEIDV